jgi:1-acyl-sn-glycerol-3-phosphate acyltransferase
VTEASVPGLPQRARVALAVQRAVCLALSPLTTLATLVILRFRLRLRFAGTRELRRAYRSFRRTSDAPLLVCGNHLTMIDSALIAYALGSPLWYVLHFGSLPWNVPDRNVFAARPWQQVLTYAFKCLPIERGGSRVEVADTIARFTHLLRRGEVGMIFPEGGRSRTGRIEVENAAYGVGRIVKSVPGCRVLCVYLRGDAQREYSAVPQRGDTLRARIAWLEPKSDRRGLRGSLDISRQILSRLAELEREHLDAVA